MKVEIESEDGDIVYPLLMQSALTGAVLLMSSKTEGVVVAEAKNDRLGHHSTEWDHHCLFPFHRTIKLSND